MTQDSLLAALRPYMMVAAVLSLGVAGISYWMFSGPSAETPRPAATGAVAGSVLASSGPSPTAASAPASKGPEPVGTATSSAGAAARATPRDTTQCIIEHFPETSFTGRTPDFSSRCTDRRAYRGMLEVKSELVAAAGPHRVSEGMREWSKLGWYEMATYAVMRERCCINPLPLRVRRLVSACNVDRALSQIAASIDDREKLTTALDGYDVAIRCVYQSRKGAAFGHYDPPYGGERTYFDALVSRGAR